jgi:hypothetical protein
MRFTLGDNGVLIKQKVIKAFGIIGKKNTRLVAVLSEYTHNDDMADLLWAKDQEIEVLKKALEHCHAELDRLERAYSNGL